MEEREHVCSQNEAHAGNFTGLASVIVELCDSQEADILAELDQQNLGPTYPTWRIYTCR